MTTRTFNQLLQGYGSEAITAVATIDGAQVFSGTVNTLDQPLPDLPDNNDYGVATFEWNKPIEFEGQITMTVAHTGESGVIMITDTLADWSKTFPIDPATGNIYLTTSGADNFVEYYYQDRTDAQGDWVNSDPYNSVDINGANVFTPATREYAGQHYYFLMPGDVMTATLTIDAGYANVNPPPSQAVPT
jgi:hypothetical protein